MGVEVLLLFGLGITGVVLTNLLSGATATEAPASAAPAATESDAAGPPLAAADLDTSTRGPAIGWEDDGAIPVAPHVRPSIWGRPAPLARFLALVVVAAVVLCSALWGIGWFVARAVEGMVAGG